MKDNLRRLVDGLTADTHSALIQVRGMSSRELGDVVGEFVEEPKPNGKPKFFPTGTNQILSQLGFKTINDRTSYLETFNGDSHYGADIIRSGYQLAVFHGDGRIFHYENFRSSALEIMGFLHRCVQAEVIRRKEVTKMIVEDQKAIAMATANADYVIEQLGVNNLSGLNNLSALNFKGEIHLVPYSDLGQIMKQLSGKVMRLASFPAFMESLGYAAADINGIKMYTVAPRK